jgi:hypothetical protein
MCDRRLLAMVFVTFVQQNIELISVRFLSPPPLPPINNSGQIQSSSDYTTPERTPHDIYREIVCECAEIEQKSSSPSNNAIICANCRQSSTIRNTNNNEETPSVSIEDFVKLIVTAIRESDITGRKKPSQNTVADITSIENAEEILRRKRQQNNDAAARYRKRQRIDQKIANAELNSLTMENHRLNLCVDQLQTEIDRLKRAVLLNRSR